jgi:hypothetical protein
MRTQTAERVLTAARLMLIRHGDEFPVDPRALEWARTIVSANDPEYRPNLGGRPFKRWTIKDQALANRHALQLAWMP